MTKALASFPEERRMQVAMRRAGNLSLGNGYWGSVAFLNSKGIRTKEQKLTDAVSEVIKNANNQVEGKQRKWENENGSKKQFGATRFKRPGIPTFTGKSKSALNSARKQFS